MPLPDAPTLRPKGRPASPANNDLLIKALLCIFIGLGVLLAPYFITSPGMQGIVGNSALVGWFALVLGIGFAVAYGRRRLTGKSC